MYLVICGTKTVQLICLKNKRGEINQPEPFEDDFQLAIVLYVSVDQPAIYRMQVKVTQKKNSLGIRKIQLIKSHIVCILTKYTKF